MAMSGGQTSGPTPWWQIPGDSTPGAVSNLQNSAPPGYTYDLVKAQYVPTSQSAPAQNDLYKQLTGSLSGLTGATGASGSPGITTPPTVGFGGGPAVGGVSAPSGPSTSGTPTFGPSSGGVPNIKPAQDAAYARAKDAAGNESRASINSLNDEMAGRGALGSGITNQGLADRISASTNALGDVNTAQMGDAFASAQHEQDLANSNQQLGFTGAITQRGQDIQAQTAQASLAQQKQLALANLLQLSLGGLTKLAS